MFNGLIRIIVIGLAMLALGGAALAQNQQPGVVPGPTLNSVLSRGEVACGVNQDLRGFGYLDPNTGDVRGFDVDLCRALATAVFGDAAAARLVSFSGAGEAALSILEAGDIDVLLRNVIWTFGADARPALHFGPVTFYSSQSFMVRVDSEFRDWLALDGAVICLTDGLLAADALPPAMAGRGLSFQPLVSPTAQESMDAFVEGRCQAYTANIVELEGFRQRSTDPSTYTVWQERDYLYTQEPFAPVYRSDDPQWADIVNWTILGLIQAEQMGITSENVNGLARRAGETDAEYTGRVGRDIASFLDSQLGLGEQIGLPKGFMLPVIREVGNYGEIYNRHFSFGSGLLLDRGLNNLWRDGGLMYAPAWR